MDINKIIKKVNKKSIIAAGIGAGAAAAGIGAVIAHKVLKNRKKQNKILELPYV